MSNRLEGKVAVITGATSGIGWDSAMRFVSEGAKVVVAGRREDRGKALEEMLGGNGKFQRCDVRQESDIVALVDFAVSTYGKIDVMFNNAGGPAAGLVLSEMTTEDIDDAMILLARSVMVGTREAAKHMMAQGSGSIINTASVAAHSAGLGGYTYSAAKAAVVHFSKIVAKETGESGVRVNSISPGGVATEIFGRYHGYDGEQIVNSVKIMENVLAQAQPIKRAGMPADISETAIFLASDGGSFINGQDIVVDGGMIGGRMWTETMERLGPDGALAQAFKENL